MLTSMLDRRWFAILFFFGLAAMLSAEEISPLPRHFTASIGGFYGSSFRIELHKGVLNYTSYDPGHRNRKTAIIKPKPEQWRAFRAALDDLEVWRWQAEYPSSGTADGTQWLLDIAYPDHALKTYGDNNFPDDAGKPNRGMTPTKAFLRYLGAVQKLIGKGFR
jgi:hypothetical protein